MTGKAGSEIGRLWSCVLDLDGVLLHINYTDTASFNRELRKFICFKEIDVKMLTIK